MPLKLRDLWHLNEQPLTRHIFETGFDNAQLHGSWSHSVTLVKEHELGMHLTYRWDAREPWKDEWLYEHGSLGTLVHQSTGCQAR